MSSVAHPQWASGAGRFKTLYQLLAVLSQATALEDICEAAVTSLLSATAADRAAILLFDDDGVVLFKAVPGLSDEYETAVTGHSPWPRGTRHAQPLVVPDVLLDQSLAAQQELLSRDGIRAAAFVPLALEAGVCGEFVLYYAQPHECTTDELEIANAIAVSVALAAERKRAEIAVARGEQRSQKPASGVTGVCGIADDITERKQLETAALHLASIVESSEDAIISKDLRGIITSWNNGAERIFGYTAAEIVGQPVALLAAPDRLDEMPEILSKIKQGRRVEHYETRRRRKDGQVIDVALTVSPVRDTAGRIVGASKIARDISDQKRAEQERALLLSREREARRTAEMLNRAAPRLLAQLDLEKLAEEVTDIATTLVAAEFGSFFHNVVNDKGESCILYSLSGVPREAFAGFPMPRNTDIFAPTFRAEGVLRCDDVTQDPRYGKNSPFHGMPKELLPIRSYLAAPVVSRSGEVLGGLFFGHSAPGKFSETHEAILAGVAAQAAIAMDNARLFEQAHWAQTELKRSNEELRRANQDLEVFGYSASHDLQEPLRTISISAQILERNLGQRLAAEDATFLAHILTASGRMNTLIEDLLAYTRATKYEEGPAPNVDSARVLAKVLESMWGALEEAGANVTATELPMVAMHEGRLAQLFQNLVSNAIKYRSKEAPRVHVAAHQRDGWWVFSVVDNGIGIEAQYAERIFGLFKRLHGRDHYPGSGIGLAICQRVVEQYGGRIWLEQSTPGQGSTFCFALPARP